MSLGGVERRPLFRHTTSHSLGLQQRTTCSVNFRASRKVYVPCLPTENTQRIVCGHEMHAGNSYETHGATTVFYLGINDCGRTPSDDLEPIIEAVFDVLHDLYTKFSARNFVLIDVPPIDRSPGGMAQIFLLRFKLNFLHGPSRGIRLN
jgi:hypothetical protein